MDPLSLPPRTLAALLVVAAAQELRVVAAVAAVAAAQDHPAAHSCETTAAWTTPAVARPVLTHPRVCRGGFAETAATAGRGAGSDDMGLEPGEDLTAGDVSLILHWAVGTAGVGGWPLVLPGHSALVPTAS